MDNWRVSAKPGGSDCNVISFCLHVTPTTWWPQTLAGIIRNKVVFVRCDLNIQTGCTTELITVFCTGVDVWSPMSGEKKGVILQRHGQVQLQREHVCCSWAHAHWQPRPRLEQMVSNYEMCDNIRVHNWNTGKWKWLCGSWMKDRTNVFMYLLGQRRLNLWVKRLVTEKIWKDWMKWEKLRQRQNFCQCRQLCHLSIVCLNFPLTRIYSQNRNHFIWFVFN